MAGSGSEELLRKEIVVVAVHGGKECAYKIEFWMLCVCVLAVSNI